MVLICVFLVISDLEHLFICILAMCRSSLESVCSGLSLFFNWVVGIFGVEFYKFFIHFGY